MLRQGSQENGHSQDRYRHHRGRAGCFGHELLPEAAAAKARCIRASTKGRKMRGATRAGIPSAENVVIATGRCQPQKKPNFAEKIPSRTLQIHSMDRTFLLQVGIRP